MKLSGIHVYPVKSLGGISLSHADVEVRGLRHDRRWLLVDEDDHFLTQRAFPQMALCAVSIGADMLRIAAPGCPSLCVPYDTQNRGRRAVRVWQSAGEAVAVSEEADQWFSDFLGIACHLLYMPDDSRRLVSPDHAAHEGDLVSFADGYPLMLLSEASLADLNSRLEQPVPMNRFRPNLVVTGTEPFAEDSWKLIRVGSAVFHVAKPCARCVMTTINQETAERGTEPMTTLAKFRLFDQKILFGQNLIPEGTGTISLGDTIEVLQTQN